MPPRMFEAESADMPARCSPHGAATHAWAPSTKGQGRHGQARRVAQQEQAHMSLDGREAPAVANARKMPPGAKE